MIVQIIHTQWTKAARGAPLAALRNRVPDALPIAGGHVDRRSCLVNYVTFVETNKFSEPVTNSQMTHDLGSPVCYRTAHTRPHALELVLPHSTLVPVPGHDEFFEFDGYAVRVDHGLTVKQLLSHEFSSVGARHVFQLKEDEWGRIRFNWRSAVQAGTVYEQITLNIASTGVSDPRTFVATVPAQAHERLKQLF